MVSASGHARGNPWSGRSASLPAAAGPRRAAWPRRAARPQRSVVEQQRGVVEQQRDLDAVVGVQRDITAW